jgi:DNA-binding transcriptional MerR regulator
LQQIRRWTDDGLSLERVRELFEAERNPQLPIARSRRGEVEVWSHIVLDDGVELHIEPGRAGLSPEQVRALARACQAAHAAIQSPSNKKENSR